MTGAAIVSSLLLHVAVAFAPSHTYGSRLSSSSSSSSTAHGAYVFVEMDPIVEEEELIIAEGEGEEQGAGGGWPMINGWKADEKQFCAGLPGACAPLGKFDPLGFTEDMPVQEIKRLRESEVMHCRVSMLAVVGYLVGESRFGHLMFRDAITGPANTHLAQLQKVSPFFFGFLATCIALAEIARAMVGWESPVEAVKKNLDVPAKTWMSKLNDDYYPGDLGFDPLGLKPRNPEEFVIMQTKELNNGRLAMFAAIGMMVQEQVTHHTLL